MDKRLRKIHKDILSSYKYNPKNWYLISEDDNYFYIKQKNSNSVRKFDKLNKKEILMR